MEACQGAPLQCAGGGRLDPRAAVAVAVQSAGLSVGVPSWRQGGGGRGAIMSGHSLDGDDADWVFASKTAMMSDSILRTFVLTRIDFSGGSASG